MFPNRRQREENRRVRERGPARRPVQAAVPATAPIRLDHVGQAPGLPARQGPKCPECGVPMLHDVVCMNCWDVC